MSTKLLNDHPLQNRWNDIFAFENEEAEIEYDAQMLRFAFLSEIEKYQKLQGVKKNKLADKIKTSASYLTQLFTGSRKLNFETIAKIQRVLEIKFNISATPAKDEVMIDEEFFLDLKCKFKGRNGLWMWKALEAPTQELYENDMDKTLLQKAVAHYDDKAIPA